jgi:hypothetical protein
MNAMSSVTFTNQIQESRLGILVEPSQVRLKPNLDDPYTWERMKEKEHLFLKNISDHSNKSLMELYEGIGISFAAVRNDSRCEIPAVAIQTQVGTLHISTRRSN